MRHLILEEPTSRAALWSWRLAGFAAILALIAVALSRSQSVETVPALAVLGAALAIVGLALVCALAGTVTIWRHGYRGTRFVLGSLLLGASVLAYPGMLAATAYRLPALTDISTDLNDPPDFSRSAVALAARRGAQHPGMAAAALALQQRAYPDVQPIILDLDLADTWQLVAKAISARGWRTISESRPSARSALGHIDAIDRTLVMAMPEDITVRLRPLVGQTRIDLRSASRLGRHDLGSNARRIALFAQELQTQLDAR